MAEVLLSLSNVLPVAQASTPPTALAPGFASVAAVPAPATWLAAAAAPIQKLATPAPAPASIAAKKKVTSHRNAKWDHRASHKNKENEDPKVVAQPPVSHILGVPSGQGPLLYGPSLPGLGPPLCVPSPASPLSILVSHSPVSQTVQPRSIDPGFFTFLSQHCGTSTVAPVLSRPASPANALVIAAPLPVVVPSSHPAQVLWMTAGERTQPAHSSLAEELAKAVKHADELQRRVETSEAARKSLEEKHCNLLQRVAELKMRVLDSDQVVVDLKALLEEITACAQHDRVPLTSPSLLVPTPLRNTVRAPFLSTHDVAEGVLSTSFEPDSNESDHEGTFTPPPRQWQTTPQSTPCSVTPPPMVQAHTIRKPRLMKALEIRCVTKSVEQIRSVLQQNPELVNEPFWDHDCEPPLCCAVRLNRPTSIARLLMEHGARTDATDVHGRTPAQIASESPPKAWMHPVPFDDGAMSMCPLPMGMGFCGASETYQNVAPVQDVSSPFEIWRAELAELFKAPSQVNSTNSMKVMA